MGRFCLRANRDHNPGEEGWHVPGTGLQNRFGPNCHPVYRHYSRMLGGTRFGGAPRTEETLVIYFSGMCVCIVASFGWAFYLENGLRTFIVSLFFLGFFGGNFALFSLWLPEQYETSVRATAFSFATSVGRFIGAGVNFVIGAMVRHAGTIGKPVALTAVAFALGLLIIPFARETRGDAVPG